MVITIFVFQSTAENVESNVVPSVSPTHEIKLSTQMAALTIEPQQQALTTRHHVVLNLMSMDKKYSELKVLPRSWSFPALAPHPEDNPEAPSVKFFKKIKYSFFLLLMN